MGMTITEKIFAKTLGLKAVGPGEIHTVKADGLVIQDASGAQAYYLYRELGVPVAIPDKVRIFTDHYCPPRTPGGAARQRESEQFCRDYNIPGFYNQIGVSHQFMIEGIVKPGCFYLGADSHTTTYGALGAFSTGIGSSEACAVMATGELWLKVPESIRVEIRGKLKDRVMSKDIILRLLNRIGANGATYKTLEFCGDTIQTMSLESRCTITNMSVEGGAKSAIMAADDKTMAYLEQYGVFRDQYTVLESDGDARYCGEIRLDVSDLVPQVAVPYSPANGVPVTDSQVNGVPLDQIVLGACTNGRLEDIRIFTEILRGRKVKHGLRCIVTPASNGVFAAAARAGYIEALAEAGCTIGPAGCGGCGIGNPLLKGENCLATNNRNFRGRMGDPEAHVYVASPATAAASAITGVITDPRNI